MEIMNCDTKPSENARVITKWLLLFLVLAGCSTTPKPFPAFKTLLPPMLPKSSLAVMAVIPRAPYVPKPVHPLTLPDWKLPFGWQTNHWRVMRSTNMVDWVGVCAWIKGRNCELFMEGEKCFLRLETYVPPPPEIHVPDSDPKDE